VSNAVHVTSADSASDSTPGPLPARMLNEFAYCPRLAYLEWVQGEWADSADTVEGQFHHRRVNQPARLSARAQAGRLAGGEPKRRKPYSRSRQRSRSQRCMLVPFI
jgi:hypothetical protein